MSNNQVDSVVLLSGGMDSTTALALAVQEDVFSKVLAISFDYGQRHRTQELSASRNIARHFGVERVLVDLTDLGNLLAGSALTEREVDVPDGHYTDETMKVTVVPNRNAIMLSIAFGIARARGATKVWAGIHSGDHAIYPDCREEFAQSFRTTMILANIDLEPSQRIYLATPFIHMTKQQIVERGSWLGVPYELTYSCYKGETYHCGTCGTCVERKEAFELAKIGDPTDYAPTPAAV